MQDQKARHLGAAAANVQHAGLRRQVVADHLPPGAADHQIGLQLVGAGAAHHHRAGERDGVGPDRPAAEGLLRQVAGLVEVFEGGLALGLDGHGHLLGSGGSARSGAQAADGRIATRVEHRGRARISILGALHDRDDACPVPCLASAALAPELGPSSRELAARWSANKLSSP